MEKFLRISFRWQILLMAIPAIILITFNNPFLVLMSFIIYLFVQYIWINSLIELFNKKLPGRQKLDDSAITLHIILLFIIYSGVVLLAIIGTEFSTSNPFLALLIFALFLYQLIAIFLIMNFLSKLLLKVETGEEVDFGKRFGEFVMFLLPFIGLFWLYPRITKILRSPENFD